MAIGCQARFEHPGDAARYGVALALPWGRAAAALQINDPQRLWHTGALAVPNRRSHKTKKKELHVTVTAIAAARAFPGARAALVREAVAFPEQRA